MNDRFGYVEVLTIIMSSFTVYRLFGLLVLILGMLWEFLSNTFVLPLIVQWTGIMIMILPTYYMDSVVVRIQNGL